MLECPWYASAHAVRRYIEVTGSKLSFDDASDELIAYCSRAWLRYQGTDRQPKVARSGGAYVYRGPGPHRLGLVVVMERRPEGPKPQLVDVLPTSAASRGPAVERDSRPPRPVAAAPPPALPPTPTLASTSAWTVSDLAVERYREIRRHPVREKRRAPVPGVHLSVEEARQALLGYAEQTRRWYREVGHQPKERGAGFGYRGVRPGRLLLVVSPGGR